jgi:hypothetical protein
LGLAIENGLLNNGMVLLAGSESSGPLASAELY